MRTLLKWIAGAAFAASAGLLGYGLHGYFSARADAPALAIHADRLIALGQGPDNLGPGRLPQLLLVEDPGFWNHKGVDITSRGGGLTTLTQSLGKEVGFSKFRPGIRKVRLIGYALGLESRLSKKQILALYLDTVWMGRGPNGSMQGFFTASQVAFGRRPAELSQHQFLTLVAVPIAPRIMKLTEPGPQLIERTRRIERLVGGHCRPDGLRDVWLNGCSGDRAEHTS